MYHYIVNKPDGTNQGRNTYVKAINKGQSDISYGLSDDVIVSFSAFTGVQIQFLGSKYIVLIPN